MEIPGFDYKPSKILVNLDGKIGATDLIWEDGKPFAVPEWAITHDGDTPSVMIPLDAANVRSLDGNDPTNLGCSYYYPLTIWTPGGKAE